MEIWHNPRCSKSRAALALLDAPASNPVLVERPIVRDGDRAALGRPPENVLTLLG